MNRFTSMNKNGHLANLGAFGIAAAVGQVMMMLFAFLLARHVGPSNYGFYIASFSLLFLTSIIFNNGLDTWLLNQKRSDAELHQDFSQILSIKILGGLLWAGLIIIIAPLIRPDLYLRTLLVINAVDIWTDAVFMSSLAVLNIQGKVKQYSLALILSRTFKLLSLLVLMLLKSEDILAFASGRAIVSVIVAASLILYLKPKVFPTRFGSLWEKLRSARFFALSEFLATIYMQIDLTLLNLMAGTLQVGIYSPASNMINALFVLPTAVHLYTLPRLSRQAYDDPKEFIRFAKRINLLTAMLGIVLSLGIFIFGGWVMLKFLGAEYLETSRIIVLLSPILLMKSIEFGAASVIVAGGEQKRRILPQVVASVVNVLLNLLLIPKLGADGAARTYLVSESILMLWYGWIAIDTLKKMSRQQAQGGA